MKKERFGLALLALLCGTLLICAQQTPPTAPQQGGRGRGGGGRGGRGRPAGRKVVLAWADTRNGIAQHDSVSHALAIIERLGYESGLWDTYIRTDSNIASYHPQMTTGQPASGGPSFNNVDAIFFMGHREVPIDDQQKADLLKFVHDDGKGFVAAHVGLTALMDVAGIRRDARRAVPEPSLRLGCRNGHQRGSELPRHAASARVFQYDRRVLPGEELLARKEPRRCCGWIPPSFHPIRI